MGRREKPFLLNSDSIKFQSCYYSCDCEPETALWKAVLQQAGADFYGACAAREFGISAKRTQIEAQRWFESESNSIGSFKWLSSLLCCEPNWLKRKILQD